MYAAGLSELATLFTLRDGAALFLDFKERAVGVVTGRGAVALDTRFAGEYEELDNGENRVSYQANFLLFTKTYARECQRVCTRNEKLLTMVRNKLEVYTSGSTSVSTAPDRELQWEKEGYIMFLICLVI